MKDTLQIVGKVFEDIWQDTIVRGFKCKTKSGANYLLHETYPESDGTTMNNNKTLQEILCYIFWFGFEPRVFG